MTFPINALSYVLRIKSKACFTVAEEDMVIIGDDIMDFKFTKSESSPLLTTLSKMSVSVTIPIGFPSFVITMAKFEFKTKV